MQKIDLKNLSVKDTLILVGSVLAALVFGWYKAEYLKLAEKKAAVEKKMSQVESMISTFQMAVMSPEQIKKNQEDTVKVGKDMEVARAEIGGIKDRMSAKSVNILHQLKKEAGRKGGILRSFKTSEKKITKGKYTYKEIGITMKIQSEYRTIMSLIEKFQNVPEFLTLKSLEAERVEDILPLVETILQFELVVF